MKSAEKRMSNEQRHQRVAKRLRLDIPLTSPDPIDMTVGANEEVICSTCKFSMYNYQQV